VTSSRSPTQSYEIDKTDIEHLLETCPSAAQTWFMATASVALRPVSSRANHGGRSGTDIDENGKTAGMTVLLGRKTARTRKVRLHDDRTAEISGGATAAATLLNCGCAADPRASCYHRPAAQSGDRKPTSGIAVVRIRYRDATYFHERGADCPHRF
jgi:hypothetical protein